MNDLDAEPDFAALRAKSRKRALAITAAIVVVGGGAVGYGVIASAEATEAENLKVASAARDCLLRAPLAEGESATLRLRSLQLATMGISDSDLELKRAETWPLSCLDEFKKAKDLIASQPEPQGVEALDKAIDFLSKTNALYEDPKRALPPALDVLDQFAPGPVSTGQHPLPKAVLNSDTLRTTAPLSKQGTAMSRAYTEDNPGANLPVLIAADSLKAPVLCTFSDDVAAHCDELSELADVKGHGMRLLGTSDANSKTMIFAGRRGKAGVFVAGEDKPLTRIYSYGGYTSADGFSAVLGFDEEEHKMALVRRQPDGKTERTLLDPNFQVDHYFYSAQLLWDQVVVRGVTPDNERRLFTLPLKGRDSDDFSLADVGTLAEPGLIRHGEENQTHITGCRTEKATVLRVKGRNNDFITFRIGDKFSEPVYGPTWGTLGCYGSTATFVAPGYTEKGTHLHYASCTSAGCDLREFSPADFDRGTLEMRPNDVRYVQAVDVNGRLLVVWKAGDHGGLRMRMAEPERFAQAEDRLLFDDLIHEGELTDASTILGCRLYSRENFGVLLLSTMAGLHAFRIAPDGTVTPFEVK